jgi:hypothetical protein
MRLGKVIALLGMVVMGVVLIYGFTIGDFSGEGAVLTRMPWGIVSLADVYVGFILFCGWVFFREKSLLVAALWTVAVLVLGNLVTCLYVLLALYRTRGDWPRFWMGHRAASPARLDKGSEHEA